MSINYKVLPENDVFFVLSEHMTGIGHILMKFVLFQISCYFLTQLFSHLVTAFKIHGVFSKFVLFLLSLMDGGKSGAVFLTAYGHSTSVSIQHCQSQGGTVLSLSWVSLLKILI